MTEVGIDPPAGPLVGFADPALVSEIAALEAAHPDAQATFSWLKSVAWALALALVGSALYAGIVYATETQFGIVSIVIGILAGIGAARGGRSRQAQIVGASASAIGYFAGQVMTVALVAGSRFFELPPEVIAELMWKIVEATFSSMDALFLAIAVHQGWSLPRART